MKNLTGIASSFPSQRSFETGDDLNEANLEQAFQSTADRAQWLKATIDDLLATGVKKLRIVSGSSSLKALTGMVTGDIAFISPASVSTFGLYVFRGGSTLGADVAGWAYDADNASGHWARDVGFLMALGGAGGTTPQLRQDRLAVPNRIVSVTTTAENSPVFREVTADGVWQDLGMSVEPSSTLQAGDIVIVDGGGSITNATDAQYANARLAVVTPSSTTVALVGSRRDAAIPTISEKVPVAMTATYVVPSDGSYSFKVQVQGPMGHILRMYTDRLVRAMVIRPLSSSKKHPEGVPFLRGPYLLLCHELVWPFLPGPVRARKDPLLYLGRGTLLVELPVDLVHAPEDLLVSRRCLCRGVHVHKNFDLCRGRNRASGDEPQAVLGRHFSSCAA